MIRPDDFQIEITQSATGATIRVHHRPTGKEQVADEMNPGEVGQARDRLIRKLKSELYDEKEFVTRIGRAEGGDFVQVIHLPSGKSRLTHPIGKRDRRLLISEMTDSILEELFHAAQPEQKSQ